MVDFIHPTEDIFGDITLQFILASLSEIGTMIHSVGIHLIIGTGAGLLGIIRVLLLLL